MTPHAAVTTRDRFTFDLGSSPANATSSPSGILRATELATGAVTIFVLEKPTGATDPTLAGSIFVTVERVFNRQVAAGEGIGVNVTLATGPVQGEYEIEVRFSTNLQRDLDFAFTLVVDSYVS
jgi:hypothetical protein